MFWTGNAAKFAQGCFEQRKKLFRVYEEFIQGYNEDSEKGYKLEVDVKCPKEPHNTHSGLAFLHERIKNDKCKNLVCNNDLTFLHKRITMLFIKKF